MRHEAARRMIPQALRSHRYNRTLEAQINPDDELAISQRRRSQIVPAERLYDMGWSDVNHRVYQHYSEQRIRITGDGKQLNMAFITPESYRQLQNSGMQHIHIGLVMIRVYALHRRSA